jgi:hypothetical protein
VLRRKPKGRWSPDVVKAMKGADRFRVHATRQVVASELWSFGEDELAAQALAMTDDEHEAIMRISAVYENRDYPLPIEGVRISHGHVNAFATIAYFEGTLRPLNRTRRRPQKDLPARFDSSPPN